MSPLQNARFPVGAEGTLTPAPAYPPRSELSEREVRMMTGWYKAVETKELPPGTMKGVEIEGAKLLLVHGASGVRAFEDRCGHMSAPLSIGTFKSGVVKCALHSAVFDAETGAVRGQPQMHMPAAALPPEMMEAMAKMGEIMGQIRCEPLRPFPVAVESGQVLVFV